MSVTAIAVGDDAAMEATMEDKKKKTFGLISVILLLGVLGWVLAAEYEKYKDPPKLTPQDMLRMMTEHSQRTQGVGQKDSSAPRAAVQPGKSADQTKDNPSDGAKKQ